MIFYIKAILMSILPFYRVDFPIQHIPQQFEYVRYQNGAVVGKSDLKSTDILYRDLSSFLEHEKSGWKYEITDYAPQRLFSASALKINCTDTGVVANYKESDEKWVQISKFNLKEPCPDEPTAAK